MPEHHSDNLDITEETFDFVDCGEDVLHVWVDADGQNWIKTENEDCTEGVSIMLTEMARKYLALWLMGAVT